jgi:hypothetical protein
MVLARPAQQMLAIHCLIGSVPGFLYQIQTVRHNRERAVKVVDDQLDRLRAFAAWVVGMLRRGQIQRFLSPATQISGR